MVYHDGVPLDLTVLADFGVALSALPAREQVVELERVSRWLDSQRTRAWGLVAAAGIDRAVTAAVAAEVGCPPRAVQGMLESFSEVAALPALTAALASGSISAAHARAVAREVRHVETGLAEDVATVAVERVLAEHGSAATARAFAEAARGIAASKTCVAEAELARAHAARTVTLTPLRAGMARLAITASALDAAQMMDSLTAAARFGLGDAPGYDRANPADHGMAARRADAAVALITSSGGPVPGGRATAVYVTVSQATLEGGATPADLAGQGPLPAPHARALLDGAEPAHVPLPAPHARALLDGAEPARVAAPLTLAAGEPSGGFVRRLEAAPAPVSQPVRARYLERRPVKVIRVPVDQFGRYVMPAKTTGNPEARFPDAALRRHIQLRDRTCRFPGCPVPAWRCEVDHIIAWALGGRTIPENLACLCAFHHRGAKHAAGWSVRGDADVALVWRSPTGRMATTRPPSICPEHRWGKERAAPSTSPVRTVAPARDP